MSKHKQGVCPICGSKNIDYDALEVDDNSVYYPAECKACHTHFDEYYNVEFAGHYNVERRY